MSEHSFKPSSPIPYGRQTISESDINAVVASLKSPFITQGPAVTAFEHEVALQTRASYGVAVNSATSALHIACLSLDLQQGDWLWTTPITFVASANCARYCGAHVDFVDINQNSGLIDENALHNKLKIAKANSKLPKIVVPVHLAGASCNMSKIKSLSDEYGFSIIEDASHAIGGFYKDSPVGSCKYSDICVFSFHPVKIITTAEGGLATTNNPKLAKSMTLLRSHGITKDSSDFQNQPAGPWSYEQQYLGYNYRMTDLQASLGLNQLKRLNDIVLERNSIYQFYYNSFQNLPLKMLEIPSQVSSSMHLAVIRLLDSDPSTHLALFTHLREHNIGVQLHYHPVHLQPYYQQFGFKMGDFPKAEQYAISAISLPCFPGISSFELEYTVNSIKKFYE